MRILCPHPDGYGVADADADADTDREANADVGGDGDSDVPRCFRRMWPLCYYGLWVVGCGLFVVIVIVIVL